MLVCACYGIRFCFPRCPVHAALLAKNRNYFKDRQTFYSYILTCQNSLRMLGRSSDVIFMGERVQIQNSSNVPFLCLAVDWLNVSIWSSCFFYLIFSLKHFAFAALTSRFLLFFWNPPNGSVGPFCFSALMKASFTLQVIRPHVEH